MPSAEGDGPARAAPPVPGRSTLLHAALDALPVGVIIADESGAIVETNARARRILGDALQGTVEVRVHGPGGLPDGVVRRVDLRERPLAWALGLEGRYFGSLVDVTCSSGARLVLQLSVDPVRTKDGVPAGVVGVIQEASDARRRELLSLALNDVNAAVLSLLDIPEHMRSVLADSALALGADAAALVRRNGARIVRHAVGMPDEAAVAALAAFGAAMERIADVHTIDATAADASAQVRDLARHGFNAILVAPLSVTETSHDLAVFLTRTCFDDQAEDFARKLATSVSLALRSAEALRRAQSELARSRLLEEVAVAASSGMDIEKMAARVLGALQTGMGIRAGVISLREDDQLRLVASVGLARGAAGERTHMPVAGDGYITSEVARGGLMLTHEDGLHPGPGPDVPADALDMGAKRYLTVPLLYAGRVVGALDLAWDEKRPFTTDERELASAVAQTLAQAVENARLFAETAENERLSRSLTDIDSYLTAAIDVEEIAEPTLRAASSALDASAAAMLLADGDQWELVAADGLEAPVGERFAVAEFAPAQRAIEARGPVVARPDEEACPLLGLAGEAGVRSLLVVPLMRGDEAVGCLCFGRGDDRPFSAGQRDFSLRLASHVSLTLRTAHLFAAQRTIAQTLQEAMLSLPAEVPGVVVSHLYQSAALHARVGGDFYDVFELDQGYLGILIGDVSGKGLDAAVLTALVKNTVRAHAVVKGNTPAEVVSRVSDVLLKESRPETFVSLFFGMLDRRDGRLVYCNAGHPSPMLLREDGMTGRLIANSPITGAFAAARFENAEALVGLDDLLFLYTDGLTEARRQGEQYGEERLRVQLGRVCDTTPEEAIRRVVQDAVRWAGGEMTDDVAVLALKRVPLPSGMPVQQKLPLWAGR